MTTPAKVEWPTHDEVGLLFTKDAVYVDTGDSHPVGGTTAFKVKDEQAVAIKAAYKDAARYRWLRENWASVSGGSTAWDLVGWQLDEKVDEELQR